MQNKCLYRIVPFYEKMKNDMTTKLLKQNILKSMRMGFRKLLSLL